jgi:hypothetical protein
LESNKNSLEKQNSSSKNRNFIFDEENIDFDLSKFHLEKTPSTNINGILDLKYNEETNADKEGNQRKIYRNPSK